MKERDGRKNEKIEWNYLIFNIKFYISILICIINNRLANLDDKLI